MQKAAVYNNGVVAGVLVKVSNSEYQFTYDAGYYNDPLCAAISLTLPKTKQHYTSPILFAFFFGLLAEGDNKAVQCRLLRIDENDHFTRLIRTAHTDTIGAITVRELTP